MNLESNIDDFNFDLETENLNSLFKNDWNDLDEDLDEDFLF